MKVTLAGYNIDTELIKKLKDNKKDYIFTPETISAAYARISRSPKSIRALRKEALEEIERARASNRRIIFEMSHHSIAEHAVFNFDITGISRRAVEEFERFRLCSYTEKSQRYVTLKGDFVIPEEIKKTGLVNEYCEVIALQNNLYKRLFENLKSFILENYPISDDPKYLRLVENTAKEDARYILSLATQTQVGATINARNLELMIRRFASHNLEEIRELGRRLYRKVKHIAPSIILFYKANDYDQRTYQELEDYCKGININAGGYSKVVLEDYTEDGDDKILSALLFRVKKCNFNACLGAVKKMTREEKIELFKTACQYLELYDTILREFEVVNYTFSLIVSGGCFGQLKRHRLLTLINQDYDPELGITIPPSIKDIKMEDEFRKVINKTEKLYKKIFRVAPLAGSYILTNAHRKRVLLNLNLRELYHFARLREDPTAQWDIQNIANAMSRAAKKVTPITTLLLGSKTEYPEIYYRLYKKFPKVTIVPPPG
uniref:FAD-dependent thymidylate synthase n=1 Tax=candidate division WOR-3 bacterium TaxID=2052148 RepID=A0A7C6AFK3_UNCW3